MKQSVIKSLDKFKKKLDSVNLSEVPFLEQYQFVDSLLRDINGYYTPHSYETILAATYVVEKFFLQLVPVLEMAIANYHLFKEKGSSDKDISFLSFYVLCVIYYRQHNKEKLQKTLIDNYYDFNEYPLFYELVSRYFSITDNFLAGLRIDIKTIDILSKAFPEGKTTSMNGLEVVTDNVGVKCGVANALGNILEYCYLRNDYSINDVSKNNNAVIVNDEDIILMLKDDNKPTYKISDVSESDFNTSYEFIDSCIAYNPDYPKYYFIKARLLFFVGLLKEGMLSTVNKKEIISLINTSIEKINPNSKNAKEQKESYNRFKVTVKEFPINEKNWYLEKSFKYLREKDEIIHSTSVNDCPRPMNNVRAEAPYAFISYSSHDYKAVFCDLWEMHRRGIHYMYDVDMTAKNFSKEEYQKEWFRVIEEKIKDCSVVLCFISESFVSSSAVYTELELIKKYHKPVIPIDLSGLNLISKIISKYITSRDGVNINSQLLHILTEIFNDNVSVIPRGPNYDVVNHMDILERRLKQHFPEVVDTIDGESILVKGTRQKKECEDYLIIDSNNEIFMVADGVTRNDEEYDKGIHHAGVVSKLFLDSTYDYLTKNVLDSYSRKNIVRLIKEALKYGNNKVFEYNKENASKINSIEQPGSCFAIGLIFEDTFYFTGGGDCIITVIRNGSRINLFSPQTEYAFKYLKIEKDRKLLMDEYVNNPANPYGYALANGDRKLMSMIEPSYFQVESGDIIFVSSDGASDLIRFGPIEDLSKKSLEDIIAMSNKQDESLGKAYFDDKAIIRIYVGKKDD